MNETELLQSIGQMFVENNRNLTKEMSLMMDKKLEPIQQELSGLKQDVSGLKQDVVELKEDVAGLKKGQESLQKQVTKINITLENDIGKKLSALFDGHQLNSEKISHIDNTVDAIEASMGILDMTTKMNTKEITRLKANIG